VTSRTSEANRAGSKVRALRAAVVGFSAMALTTAIFSIPAALPAAADPPLTVAEAKAQIEQLQTDAAAIDQDYAGVQDQIDQGNAKLALKRADVKAQADKVAKMKLQVGQVALAQFQNRNLDTAAQLFFTEDTQGFLSQISTVEKVSENQNTVLQNFQQEQANLADLEHSTQTDLAVLQAKEKQLQDLRASSDKKVADAKAVLAKLTAEEQAKIAAEEKKAAEAAKAEADAKPAPAASTPAASTPAATQDSAADPAPSASGRGAKALAFARRQLGKPYRFGATGPNAYDCSGLTGAAWRAAGVTLSRTSQSQFHDGRAVSKADLQPGDLVFFYSSTRPSHVALYAGNGMVIHAPHPGSSVRYIKMKYMPFSGARRPG
jgi:cell wall-associated NlpC family hydrolase